MINNCIIPIDSDIEREEIRQALLNKSYLKNSYPFNTMGYKKSKCFYIIDNEIYYALNISMVKKFFPGLKIINSHKILNLKELYED